MESFSNSLQIQSRRNKNVIVFPNFHQIHHKLFKLTPNRSKSRRGKQGLRNIALLYIQACQISPEKSLAIKYANFIVKQQLLDFDTPMRSKRQYQILCLSSQISQPMPVYEKLCVYVCVYVCLLTVHTVKNMYGWMEICMYMLGAKSPKILFVKLN